MKKVKKAKAMKKASPAMQKTKKFGKNLTLAGKTTGYKGVKPGKSKSKGKKTFNAGSFAAAKKKIFGV